jgi:hypothetical protein
MYLKKEIIIFFYNKYIYCKSLYANDISYMFFCWIFLFRSYVTQICSADYYNNDDKMISFVQQPIYFLPSHL